jgi:hypothetical protein
MVTPRVVMRSSEVGRAGRLACSRMTPPGSLSSIMQRAVCWLGNAWRRLASAFTAGRSVRHFSSLGVSSALCIAGEGRGNGKRLFTDISIGSMRWCRRSDGHTGSYCYLKLGPSAMRIQRNPDPAAYRIEAHEARPSANLEDLNPVIPTATASHESL